MSEKIRCRGCRQEFEPFTEQLRQESECVACHMLRGRGRSECLAELAEAMGVAGLYSWQNLLSMLIRDREALRSAQPAIEFLLRLKRQGLVAREQEATDA